MWDKATSVAAWMGQAALFARFEGEEVDWTDIF
jgi:hypothetical protein